MNREEIEKIFEELWLEMRQMEMEDESDGPEESGWGYYNSGFMEGTYSTIRQLAKRLGIHYGH